MRTQQELADKFKAVEDDDLFCIMRPDLAAYMSGEVLQPLMKEGADLSEHKPQELTRAHVLEEMREYMSFAIEKATSERGLSATRSIQHFQVWVWLLGDEEYEEIAWADYAPYGMPILRQIAERFGFDFPTDN